MKKTETIYIFNNTFVILNFIKNEPLSVVNIHVCHVAQINPCDIEVAHACVKVIQYHPISTPLQIV